MRWLPYFILAYIALGLQTGMAHAIAAGPATPNFVLLAVIFIALSAPRDAALLGCFLLGLMQDLCSLDPLGLYALAYGLVAMAVISTQQAVYHGHPLTHVGLALAGGLMTGFVLALHGWLRGPIVPVLPLFYGALYTAVISPVVLGVLYRMRKPFHFQSSRRGGFAGRF